MEPSFGNLRTLNLEAIPKIERDTISRIIVDEIKRPESPAEPTHRIQIQDMVNLIHGGDPASIAPARGSQQSFAFLPETATDISDEENPKYCGELASDE